MDVVGPATAEQRQQRAVSERHDVHVHAPGAVRHLGFAPRYGRRRSGILTALVSKLPTYFVPGVPLQ